MGNSRTIARDRGLRSFGSTFPPRARKRAPYFASALAIHVRKNNPVTLWHAFDKLGNALDAVSGVSEQTMRFGTELAAACAALVAFASAVRAAQIAQGLQGPDLPAVPKAPGKRGAPGFMKRAGRVGAAVTASEYGPDLWDWSKGAVGPADRKPSPDYDATHPQDTLERLRRECDERNAMRLSLSGGANKIELTGSANVEGETKIRVEVEVKPTSEFLRAVVAGKDAKAQFEGHPQHHGSTGLSSPDAAAPITEGINSSFADATGASIAASFSEASAAALRASSRRKWPRSR